MHGDPPLSAEAPQTIGNYQLREYLGGGGMGSVYRAIDGRSGESVAIKLIHRHLVDEGNPALLEMFRREADVAARLQSPFTVHTLNFASENGRFYLVTEYVDGGSLAERITLGRPLPPRDALTIASQVAQALEEADAHGIVHRDIKPANILLRRDGSVKLADFGIARVAGRATIVGGLGGFAGTPIYAAPEQHSGQADIRSDIYALGVVLFEILTGDAPFHGQTPWELGRLHASQPLPMERLAGLPEPVQAVVVRCLAKLPADRFQDPSELVSALSRARRAIAPTPVPPMPWQDPTQPPAVPRPSMPEAAPAPPLSTPASLASAPASLAPAPVLPAPAPVPPLATEATSGSADTRRWWVILGLLSAALVVGVGTWGLSLIVPGAADRLATPTRASGPTVDATRGSISGELVAGPLRPADAIISLTPALTPTVLPPQPTSPVSTNPPPAPTNPPPAPTNPPPAPTNPPPAPTGPPPSPAATNPSPAPTRPSAPTSVATPPPTDGLPTPLPPATPPAQPAPNGQLLLGSANGELQEKEDVIAVRYAGASLRDATAEVRFINPDGNWSYGLGFRDTGTNRQYRLVLTSSGRWALILVQVIDDKAHHDQLASGPAPLNTRPNAANTIRLTTTDTTGTLYINGTMVTTLDLGAKLEPGDIFVASGLLINFTAPGRVTRYERFSVWAPPDKPADHPGPVKLPPSNGELLQRDTGLATRFADVDLLTPAIEARFTNPDGRWSYGFGFRSTGPNRQYRLIFDSDGRWTLELVDVIDGKTDFRRIARGTAPNLSLRVNATNLIRLTTRAELGELFVNGAKIAELNLADKDESGDVFIATSLFNDFTVPGRPVRYQGFTVWDQEE